MKITDLLKRAWPNGDPENTVAPVSGTGGQSRSQIKLALLFFVGWPALIGVILGWTGAGTIGGVLPRPIAIAYWVVGMLLLRLSLEISTRLVAFVVPKGKVPLAALCLLAIPIQVYFSAPLTYLWRLPFLGLVPETAWPNFDALFFTSFEQYLVGLRASVVVALEWVIANLVFDRVFNFARFRKVTGYEPPPQYRVPPDEAENEALSASESRFLEKIPKRLGVDVIALSAEDHYVRVHTPIGKTLVLYRFSDAMAEMPKGIGFQVHRSHWVRKSAITDFQKRGPGQVLILNETLEIPVSKRFIEVVKASGLTPIDPANN